MLLQVIFGVQRIVNRYKKKNLQNKNILLLILQKLFNHLYILTILIIRKLKLTVNNLA